MTDDGKYKVTYNFSVKYENVDLEYEPKNSLTEITFDGTDAHMQLVVNQFVTFLKAAGYIFNDLEIIR